MSEFVVEKISAYAESLLASMGLELVDVQYRQEGHGWVLRLFIDNVDSQQGITVDHCAKVSREMSDYLDVEDCIQHAYNLEVSSPGVERPLVKISDFERFVGKKARVKLRVPINEQRVLVGDIGGVDDDRIEMTLENGDVVTFSHEDIRKARLSL